MCEQPEPIKDFDAIIALMEELECPAQAIEYVKKANCSYQAGHLIAMGMSMLKFQHHDREFEVSASPGWLEACKEEWSDVIEVTKIEIDNDSFTFHYYTEDYIGEEEFTTFMWTLSKATVEDADRKTNIAALLTNKHRVIQQIAKGLYEKG